MISSSSLVPRPRPRNATRPDHVPSFVQNWGTQQRWSMRRRCETGSWHPPYSSIVVVVLAAVPAAPVMWTVIVAVPTSIAIVGGRVVVISISVVPVRAIIVRTPPAPSPRITNPANRVDIGWRCRGSHDRHGAGAGSGERANCSGGCNSKDGFSHLIPHRIEDAA